jgi:hypothetical protein
MVDSCTGILPKSEIPDCEEFDNSTGNPTFPKTHSTYVINGITYNVPCNDYPEDQDGFVSFPPPFFLPLIPPFHLLLLTFPIFISFSLVGETTVCPRPFELRHEGRADPPCQLPCLTPFWTRNQWDTLFLLQAIFASITVACGVWVAICWLAQERLRRFPAHLPIVPAISVSMAGLIWVVSSIIGNENVAYVSSS